jgi:hypothetical protein
MVHRRRRSSRRRRARRWPFLVGSGLFVIALALAIMLADLPHRPDLGDVPVPGAALDAGELADADTARPVYPYSIVEGGIASVDELREQIARDPVVAAHYRDFDLSKARIERLEKPRVAYVSYRMNDAVYWTRRPVFVPAGETIVTDGTLEARTRCANLLSVDPGLVSDDEPDPDVLDTPLLPLRGPGGLVPIAIGALPPNGAGPGETLRSNGAGAPGGLTALHSAASGAGTGAVSGNSEQRAPGDSAPGPPQPLMPDDPGPTPPGPNPSGVPPLTPPGPPSGPPNVPPFNPPNGSPMGPPFGPPNGPPLGPPFHPPPGAPVYPPYEPPYEPPYAPPNDPPFEPPYDPPGPDGDPQPPVQDIPEPGLSVLMLGLVAAAARVRRRAASRA